jgi:hypothetical protein
MMRVFCAGQKHWAPAVCELVLVDSTTGKPQT